MSEKIQKRLAHAGLGSRRLIETWLAAGRIQLNNHIAKLGDRMTEFDQIKIDGREIALIKSQNQKVKLMIYHKPEGEICSRSDPEGRPTIFEQLPALRNGRWISVGRLDFNTSGLLLITNNGELANQLMHPSKDIEREYAVRTRSVMRPGQIQQLQDGVKLDDGMAHVENIVDGGGAGANHWYHVVVKEGRNRLVRRLFEAVDMTVSRLIRVRFGDIVLPPYLRKGHTLELEDQVIDSLIE